jgi:hypothetical protein
MLQNSSRQKSFAFGLNPDELVFVMVGVYVKCK